MPKKRRGVVVVLRILISVGLLAFFLWYASPAAIWRSWQGISPLLLLGVIVIQLAGHALSAAKWQLVLRAQGYRLSYWWLLGLYLVGQFANNFLPTTVGGDTVRAAQLGNRIGSYGHAAASVLVERMTGFWALSILGAIALWASMGIVTSSLAVTLLVLATACATTLVLLGMHRAQQIASLVARLRMPVRLRGGVQRLFEALQTASGAPGAMLGVLALSLLFQSLWIVQHTTAGASLHLRVPGIIYAVMVPLTDILGLVPLFFNNLGVREGVFTLYLGQIGISRADAIALSVLIFSVRLAVSALGGILLAIGGLRQARAVLGTR